MLESVRIRSAPSQKPQYLEEHMKHTIRYGALLLAVLPFLIAGVLLIMQEALNSVGYLLGFAFSLPVLTAMSILSAYLAFSDKDPERKLTRTTKVLSLLSMAVFGVVCLIVLYSMVMPLWSNE